MDDVDPKALLAFVLHGRVTSADLGEGLGLSAPGAAERGRRLEEEGAIRGYAAVVDPAKLGFPLTAYVFVSISDQRKRAGLLRLAGRHRQVVECHHVAGED